MHYRSMHNPQYARNVWNTFRDSRPVGRHALLCRAAETTTDTDEGAGPPGDELMDEDVCSSRGQQARTPPEDRHENQGAPTMTKLNAGVSRKVGQPNYGSRGATVNVELELESSAVQDAELLHDRIRKLFAIARQAVAEELGLSTQTPTPQPGQPTGANGNGNAGRPRPASEAQIRAINAICGRLGLDPAAEAHRHFGRSIQDLTLAEASSLIDLLKQLQNGQPGR